MCDVYFVKGECVKGSQCQSGVIGLLGAAGGSGWLQKTVTLMVTGGSLCS